MNLGHVCPRASHRAAALAVTGLLACGSPEPSITMTESSTADLTDGSTAAGPSTGDSSGEPGSGSGQDTTGTGAPTSGPGDDTTGTDAPTSTTTSGATETGVAAPTFAEIYESVLMPNNCLSGYCHDGMAGELVMTDEATAYANLVEVAATEVSCGLDVRVVPGAPEESVLWRRIRPAALDAGDMCAAKMPQGSMGLEDVDAQLVYDWIAAGAPE